MGWTGNYRTTQAAIDEAFEGSTIVAQQAKSDAIWVVIEHQGKRHICGCIFEGGTGCYRIKVLDEACGPAYFDVPLGFFSLAPVAPGPYALAWRQKVYARYGVKVPDALLAQAPRPQTQEELAL